MIRAETGERAGFITTDFLQIDPYSTFPIDSDYGCDYVSILRKQIKYARILNRVSPYGRTPAAELRAKKAPREFFTLLLKKSPYVFFVARVFVHEILEAVRGFAPHVSA